MNDLDIRANTTNVDKVVFRLVCRTKKYEIISISDGRHIVLYNVESININ